MASTALTKTFSSASSASDRYKFTFSTWFKRGIEGDNDYLFGHQSSDGSNDFAIRLDKDSGNSLLRVYDYQSSSYTLHKQTTRFFRDHSAWYHLVVKIDTTQSSASDRVKIYINGVEETSFSTSVNPSQNQSVYAFSNTGQPTVIGGRYTNSLAAGYYFDGSLTHTHCCIGYAYDASSFGETDSTSGIWKPKAVPSVTYGSNGFFLKFENSGAMGTDSSGNSNTFTINGTLTQNVDTPSNNHTTWNNIFKRETATNGSTQIHPSGDASYSYSTSTLGASKGKWYFEFESNGGNGRALIGMVKSDYVPEQIGDNEEPGANAHSFAYRQNQGDIQMNNSTSSYGTQITWGTSGNVLMMAVDLDNNKVWYGVDGTWQNSGDPSNGTNGFDWSTVRTADEPYLCLAGDDTSSGYGNIQANFGSGFFGTTAVVSANADANGHGIFEYTVPTGFYTLNTKNIKEFG